MKEPVCEEVTLRGAIERLLSDWRSAGAPASRTPQVVIPSGTVTEWTLPNGESFQDCIWNLREIDPTTRSLLLLFGAVVVLLERRCAELAHGVKEIKLLREKWPQEVNDLLFSIYFKELSPILRELNKAKREAERKKAGYNREAADKRYERRREMAPLWPGRIEREFSGEPSLGAILPMQLPPTCLDGIFRGEAVPMANSSNSLQALFGLDRHRFGQDFRPKILGRKKVYGYRAFLIIAERLLGETKGSKRWLSDPQRRLHVLSAIQSRVEQVSPPRRIAVAFRRFFSRVLPRESGKSG